MIDESSPMEESSFDEWKRKLPRVTVDGIQYYVVHGDELRDEFEIARIWSRRHEASPEEAGTPTKIDLRFLDIRPDLPTEPIDPITGN